MLVDKPHFGYNINSDWKRRIWLGAGNDKYILKFSDKWISDLYENIVESSNRTIPAYESRLNLIRMIYFLNSSEADTWPEFECSFLNSPGFKYFKKIQDEKSLKIKEKSFISRKVRHVVKEYFLGMKLPESEDDNKDKIDVYIAMSRNISSIKQTAQIILNKFSWSSNSLGIFSDCRGLNQFIFNFSDGIKLEIPLPFLDYLLNCHLGVMDDPAFSSYRKRLDNLKDQILSKSKKGDDAEMEIAFFDLKRNLSLIKYTLEDGKIVVMEQ